MKRSIVIISILLTCVQSTSLINWLWSEPKPEKNILVADGIPLISIPYEAMTDDEKFLQEAAKITDIQISSPLETCQHKVVMKIRTSCSAMTEEELAKLSVNLLNCQSAVEGRKIFPCTESMSLKQCTTNMDADMWNAYHLMSNRARAVCYSARSTQFRALTELTVNKLMQSARMQIDTLSSLKESHERLEDQTSKALSSLSSGNKILLEQQQYLKDAQASAHNLVANNLRELNNEKALIRSGHAQLSMMTEDIKKRLEKASELLMSQTFESQNNHRELLDDLLNIQQQAQSIWDKIETSTNRIVAQNAEAAAQYEETLKKLEKINGTIHFIWNVTENMRAEIDEKLGWITEYIGNTGEHLQKIYRISLHIVYLLGAMIIAAFLNAPFLTRATIMGMIPLNLVTYLKHGMNACLDFTSLTFLIFLITGMHFIMVGIQYLFGADQKKNKLINDTEDTNHLNNQTIIDGHYSPHSSTPHHPKQVKTPLTIQLMNTFNDLYKFIHRKLIESKDKIMIIAQLIMLWYQGDTIQTEELSCSYLPSKKNREAIVDDLQKDYSMLSDDHSDFEDSENINEPLVELNESEDTHDSGVLRHRWNGPQAPNSTYTHYATSSRSISPNIMTEVRTLCAALTKTGSKCRSRAQQGRYFCGRHSQGSSILGD